MGNKKGHWCLAVSVYIDGTFKAKIDIMHRKLNLVKEMASQKDRFRKRCHTHTFIFSKNQEEIS